MIRLSDSPERVLVIFLLPLAVACGGDADAGAAERVVGDPAEVSQAPTPTAAPSDEEAFAKTIQGRFRRVDYPHGTIEVQGRRIKVKPGEGAVEPAKFEDFEVAAGCPDGGTVAEPGARYVVYGERRLCDAYMMRGDTLKLVLPKGGGVINYLRTE